MPYSNVELFLLFYDVSEKLSVLAGLQGGQQARDSTLITNVTATCPTISSNIADLPRAENKHLTSSPSSTFTDQTSREPSQTEGNSE